MVKRPSVRSLPAKLLPNILTSREFLFGKAPLAPKQSQWFWRSERQLAPGFTHLSGWNREKRLPKSLTLCIRRPVSASGFAAPRKFPEKAHLWRRNAHRKALRAIDRPGRWPFQIPKTLTSAPRNRPFRPISRFGSRKTSPSTCIFSRSLSPMAFLPPDFRENRRQLRVPNPLTVAFRVTARGTPARPEPPGRRLP
jgi:hypothetical protein